jgi:hypothetical protein
MMCRELLNGIRDHNHREMTMSVRRILISMALVLAVAGCAENLSPPAAVDQGPHFLRWATPTRPEFAFEGADAVGSRFASLSSPTPPVVDQSSSAHGKTGTLSWSHVVGTGSNPLLVVGVSVSTGKTVTSVTYRGAALTYLGGADNSQAGMRAELWYLTAPAPGTGTVSVKVSGKTELVGGAVSFFGAHPSAPLASLVSASSTTDGTNAAVTLASASGDRAISVLVIGGGAALCTPTAGQAEHWDLYSSVISGGASTVVAGGPVTMGWTASSAQPWALAAAAIRPAPHLALTQYQATFWARRGQSRSLQINYAAGDGTSPFMKLTISNPTYVPGRGTLAVGDSVLVTATVDPDAIVVTLEPHGMLFDTPAQLQIWYGGAGGDLNGDGVVNSTDAFIETWLLSMWYQATPTDPWWPILATKSLSTKSFTAALPHFSGYAVAW